MGTNLFISQSKGDWDVLQNDRSNSPFQKCVCLIISGSTVSESNGDGTFKLKTTLQMKFNKSDDGDSFRCIVQPQSGRGDKVTTDSRIFVRCKLISKLAMLTLSVHCEPLNSH